MNNQYSAIARGVVFFAMVVIAGCASPPQTKSDDPTRVARLNTQLAFEYLKERNYPAAVEKLEKALALDASYIDAQIAGGIIYSQLGERGKADKHYRNAMGLDDKNITLMNNYGLFLCNERRYSEGIELLEEATELPLNTNPLASFNNAGQCAYENADLERAEEHLRRALQINPRLPPALLTMSRLSYEYDRMLPARAYLQRYHEVRPESPATLLLGYQIETKLEDRASAEKFAENLRKDFPDSPEANELRTTGVDRGGRE